MEILKKLIFSPWEELTGKKLQYIEIKLTRILEIIN